MQLEIPNELKKYCKLSKDRSFIKSFGCPVNGCNYKTSLGPGALRMHIILGSDPELESRYNEEHEKFYLEHTNELGRSFVRELSRLPHYEEESQIEKYIEKGILKTAETEEIHATAE